jgi:hypothetical protein
MDAKYNYYQYQKKHDYPIYIRVNPAEVDNKFFHLLNEMGFHEMPEKDSKKISLQKTNTRLLTVQTAGPRVQVQINGSDLLDKYGSESLSIQAGVPVYTYRKVALLAMPMGKVFWDLALSQNISLTDQMVGLRVILTRYLAMALSFDGLLCYWGTMTDGSMMLMKQSQSFGESVVIDHHRKVAFHNGGEVRIGNLLKIVRKDKEGRANAYIPREELISFLSVTTCLLTFSGITPAMKKAIYDLSAHAQASYAGHSELSANL